MNASDQIVKLQLDSATKRDSHLQNLVSSPRGFDWCREHSNLADNIWRELHLIMRQLHPDCPPIAIIATGGYGRQELAPYSDIDVSIIPLTEGKGLEDALRWIFRAADQVIRTGLGCRLSYTYRLPADVPGLDPVTLSNLLDLRLVTGSPEPSRILEQVLLQTLPDAEFILHKIDERKRDMLATNETPLVVEPNLKYGAGGLRCFHTYNWIGIALGERYEGYSPEMDKLLLARNLLHLVSGRQNDVLSRTRLKEISEILNTEPELLGSELAECLLKNHNFYNFGLRRIHENRFDIGRTARSVRGELRIDHNSPADQAAIAVDIATRLGLIIPEENADVTEESSPTALHALSGEKTIRNLLKSGVLNRLIPPLANCVTLMPADESHKYTVYEHTLVAIQLWEQVHKQPDLAEIHFQIKDSECMVLALLLHDVGKSIQGRPHSESGAEIAEQICRTWKLDSGRASLIVWLVKEHLTMSKFIRMRDIMHPETASEFAAIVQDEQRLAMLTILTYCDVNAVNPEIWTPMQQQLLIELFRKTLHILQSNSNESQDEQVVRRKILRNLQRTHLSDKELEPFLDSLPAHYLLSTDSETTALHFEYVQQAKTGEIVVAFQDYPKLRITDITVAAPDTPGALTAILGVLYAYDLTLVGLRASTTNDAQPILLDTFTVTSSKREVPHAIANRVSNAIESVLKDGNLDQLLSSMGKDPVRKQEFLKVNIINQEPAIIEIQAPRGRGLAFRLARVIAELELNIVGARVGQWAAAGSAAFYVQPRPGTILDEKKIIQAFHQTPEPQI